MEKEIQSLQPQPISYGKVPFSDDFRIWKDYVEYNYTGEEGSTNLQSVLEGINCVLGRGEYSNGRSRVDNNRNFLVMADAYFNSRDQCIVSVRENNGTVGCISISRYEHGISDLVISSRSSKVQITVEYSLIEMDLIWKCTKVGDIYEYRPVNKEGTLLYIFPYILPMIRSYANNPTDLKLNVQDLSGKPIEYNYSYIRYRLPYPSIVSKLDKRILVFQSCKGEYMVYIGWLYHLSEIVSNWKERKGKTLVDRSRVKKLKFLNLLHHKDTSTIGKHMNGLMGEIRLIREILSYLSDIDP